MFQTLIKVVWRYATKVIDALLLPLWLDQDGCSRLCFSVAVLWEEIPKQLAIGHCCSPILISNANDLYVTVTYTIDVEYSSLVEQQEVKYPTHTYLQTFSNQSLLR